MPAEAEFGEPWISRMPDRHFKYMISRDIEHFRRIPVDADNERKYIERTASSSPAEAHGHASQFGLLRITDDTAVGGLVARVPD
jgi:hypothetical protein